MVDLNRHGVAWIPALAGMTDFVSVCYRFLGAWDFLYFPPGCDLAASLV
jgi:hypothetical protein